MSNKPDRLTRVMQLILPERMAADLDAEFGENTNAIAEMIWRYASACPKGRADIAAFHDSDGPSKIETAIYKLEQGMTEDSDLL